MEKLLCFLFCLIAFLISAQDTIYKRNGEIISVKVLEVNVNEVSYKRMDLMDSPLMIVSKNEIRKIKYATGSIDSFIVSKNPVKILQPVYQVPAYVLSNPNLIRNSLRKGIYIYQGLRISDRNLISLAIEKNMIWNSKEINDHIIKYKTNKSVQYIVGYTGAAIGIIGLYGSLIAVSNNSSSNDVLYSLGAASAATGILISSQIVSFSYKLKRVKHSDKIMELYNNQFSIK
ncbi:MAG: hypothetical protein H7141_10015 [Burkholderiales bacterium]|nr:hypothetical protein [Bacteroidia bacterium]